MLKNTFWLLVYTILILNIAESAGATSIQVTDYHQSALAANTPLKLTINMTVSTETDTNAFKLVLPAAFLTSQTLNCSLGNFLCSISPESNQPQSNLTTWIISSNLFDSAQPLLKISLKIWNLQNPTILGQYCGFQIALVNQNEGIPIQSPDQICLYVNTTTKFQVLSYNLTSKVPFDSVVCTITFVTPAELDDIYNLSVTFPSQVPTEVWPLYDISNSSGWKSIEFISYTFIVITLPLKVDPEGTFTIQLAMKNPMNNQDSDPFGFVLKSPDLNLSDNSSMVYSLANVGTLNVSSYGLSSNYLGELTNFTIVTHPFVQVGINQTMYVVFNPAFDLSNASCAITMVILPMISCRRKNSTTFELAKPDIGETMHFPIDFNIYGIRNPPLSRIDGPFVRAVTVNQAGQTLEDVVLYMNTSFVCQFPCGTCRDQSSRCTSCVPHYHMLNGSCLKACPEKYFTTNGLCLKCISSCDKCSLSPYICDSCSEGYTLSSARACYKVVSDSNSSMENSDLSDNGKESISWLVGGAYLTILLLSAMISLLLNAKKLNYQTVATMVALSSIAETWERLYLLFDTLTSSHSSTAKTASHTTFTALFLMLQVVGMLIIVATMCKRRQKASQQQPLKGFSKLILIICASILNFKILLVAFSITARAKLAPGFRDQLLTLLRKMRVIFLISCVLSLAEAVELGIFNLIALSGRRSSTSYIFLGGESFNFVIQLLMVIKLKRICSLEEEQLKTLGSQKDKIADLEAMKCKEFNSFSISNQSSSLSIIKDLDVSNELQGITRDQSLVEMQIDPQISARFNHSQGDVTPKGIEPLRLWLYLYYIL